MSHRLTVKQKWKLAATLLVLFYPVLLYIDLPLYFTGIVPAPGLLLQESVTAVIVIMLLFIWINISEWLLDSLFKRFGEDFLASFNIWSQAITFAAAFVMGFGFVLASGEILEKTNWIADQVFGRPFLIKFPSPKTAEFFGLYKRANIGFFLVLMLSAFYLIGIRRSGELIRAATLKAARLEQENTMAQLSALRNQVNPHFLFNSLSILDAMVHEDNRASSAFINELAKFYRYTLEQANGDTVLVSTELDFIKTYSYLLKMRFEIKLEIRVAIDDPGLLTRRLPPLTLQMLIENAVKHNRMATGDPLIIEIQADGEYLRVKNNLRPRRPDIFSSGTGLLNIRERYKLLTGKPVVVDHGEQKFVVSVPLLA